MTVALKVAVFTVLAVLAGAGEISARDAAVSGAVNIRDAAAPAASGDMSADDEDEDEDDDDDRPGAARPKGYGTGTYSSQFGGNSWSSTTLNGARDKSGGTNPCNTRGNARVANLNRQPVDDQSDAGDREQSAKPGLQRSDRLRC